MMEKENLIAGEVLDKELVIRPMKQEDIETLVRIEVETFSKPWSADAFSDLLKQSYYFFLVAEICGKVVGICGMTISFEEGTIDKVVVDRSAWGKGIAQRMLSVLMEEGRKMGVTAYTLEVRVSNQRAIHVYEKMGFVSEGVRPRFYEKPVEDALIMWKRPGNP